MRYEIVTTRFFERDIIKVRKNHGCIEEKDFKVTTKRWDASEFLDSPELIHEYLKAAFEQDEEELLIAAIGNVAKAKGMTEIARKTNLSRQNLYKALAPCEWVTNSDYSSALFFE